MMPSVAQAVQRQIRLPCPLGKTRKDFRTRSQPQVELEMYHSKEVQYKKATKFDRPKSKTAAAKVKDTSCKSQPFSTRKRRAPLIDAATAPTPIDAEEYVACIRKRTTSGRGSEIAR